MRQKRTSQISIFDQFAQHDIGRELEGMAKLLDAHPGLLDGVAEDLGSEALTGCHSCQVHIRAFEFVW